MNCKAPYSGLISYHVYFQEEPYQLKPCFHLNSSFSNPVLKNVLGPVFAIPQKYYVGPTP